MSDFEAASRTTFAKHSALFEMRRLLDDADGAQYAGERGTAEALIELVFAMLDESRHL
jgi:hypothetical protein